MADRRLQQRWTPVTLSASSQPLPFQPHRYTAGFLVLSLYKSTVFDNTQHPGNSPESDSMWTLPMVKFETRRIHPRSSTMSCPLLHDDGVLNRILIFLRESSTTGEYLPVLRVCRRIYQHAILVIPTLNPLG
jgi:hypothetical protein